MNRMALCLACALLAGVTHAKTVTKAPAKAPAAKPAAPVVASAATETDVIGSQEAPAVLNVVPWKDKAAVLPKKEINTSILREALQPLDREVLQREVLFHKNVSP